MTRRRPAPKRQAECHAGTDAGDVVDAGGTDAGKMCLVKLVEHLKRCGFVLFDVQFRNPLLDRFGCVEVSREEYQRRLAGALAIGARWQRLAG